MSEAVAMVWIVVLKSVQRRVVSWAGWGRKEGVGGCGLDVCCMLLQNCMYVDGAYLSSRTRCLDVEVGRGAGWHSVGGMVWGAGRC